MVEVATRTAAVAAEGAWSAAAAVVVEEGAAASSTAPACRGPADRPHRVAPEQQPCDGIVIIAPVWASAPTVTANVVPATPDADNGWYRSNVEVSWTINDNGSPITGRSGCDPTTVSADTTGTTLTCSATSAAGTGSASVTIKRDATAPTITAAATTADGAAYSVGAWTNQTVTATFTCADAISGVATCPTPQTYATDGVFTASGTAVDVAGNTASTQLGPIRIDKTAPTVTATPSPGPNQYGWNNTAVTVTFTGTDNGSGVASCSPPVTFSNEGASQTASGTCTDHAGNSGPAAANVSIDRTRPVYTVTIRVFPALDHGAPTAAKTEDPSNPAWAVNTVVGPMRGDCIDRADNRAVTLIIRLI